jgi:hypothetical protein
MDDVAKRRHPDNQDLLHAGHNERRREARWRVDNLRCAILSRVAAEKAGIAQSHDDAARMKQNGAMPEHRAAG